MASITTLPRPSFSAPPLHLSTPFPTNPCPKIKFTPFRHTKLITLAMEGDNDFGARDPFPAEIESNFGDKVLGFGSTEHKILIPNLAALSLSRLECSPQPFALADQDAQNLLRKVVGWRLSNEGGAVKLQCLWKLKDYKSGVELINRIFNVVETIGHLPNLHLEPPNQVRAELWTPSIGGISMNDFIVAAKIDEIQTSDLVPRKRAWA
ncbi:putative pterin-4-alpha-carbinolamine dehydratase, chloroplastic [Apium graveolens]|uniref:putative pterin-4-alpha-carbinolamine dehydratase, chloroplastic n=1 Tax=Apium graveolens TaxID=4045 RepID=UPI003D7ACD6B